MDNKNPKVKVLAARQKIAKIMTDASKPRKSDHHHAHNCKHEITNTSANTDATAYTYTKTSTNTIANTNVHTNTNTDTETLIPITFAISR